LKPLRQLKYGAKAVNSVQKDAVSPTCSKMKMLLRSLNILPNNRKGKAIKQEPSLKLCVKVKEHFVDKNYYCKF